MVLVPDGREKGATDRFLVANLRGVPMKRRVVMVFLIAFTVARASFPSTTVTN